MNINKILSQMRTAGQIQDRETKGALGEDAIFQLISQRKGQRLLYHSVQYPYQTTRDGRVYLGNIKYDANTGQFQEYTSAYTDDEIDILYITPYRCFVIESKSYHAKYIDIYEHWANVREEPVDKNPVLQNEKHCRMLYHMLNAVLPNGNPDYIVPITCFVDRCTIRDDRAEYWMNKYPVCTLNALMKTIQHYDTPLDYNLHLKYINKLIHEKAVSIKKEAD